MADTVNHKIAFDVFAGAGGLSVGLNAAGFDVTGAIENDRNVIPTFISNHPNTAVSYCGVEELESSDITLAGLRGRIDIMAGCPPCQGFSSLTSKYRRTDPRNKLIWEMATMAKLLSPRAIMMENVPGLLGKGRSLYNQVCGELKKQGYLINEGILDVADFGVPQRRRRMVMLAGRDFEISLPTATHAYNGKNDLLPWTTVREALEPINKAPIIFEKSAQGRKSPSQDWHVVRRMSERNLERIKMTVAGKSREQLPEKLRPDCHQDGYRGFSNTYGRMQWDMPAPTITAGCTTFSKGRFGHPEEDRTISVREAALLQTFPMDYRFETPHMEHVCKMIGNALPPLFAEVLARQVRKALEENT